MTPGLDFLAFPPGMGAAEEDLAQAFAATLRALHMRQGGDAAHADAVAAAAHAVSMATSAGHSCIDLAELRENGAADGDWQGALGASPVVGGPQHEFRPLVLDRGRLYLHRYWRHERRLAARLGAINEALPAAQDGELAEALARHFPQPQQPDWQMIAAATAATRRLAIVSGGPGTGKTTTVAKMLAVLLALHPRLRVALAAPTGKAAARMQDALRAQCEQLALAAQARARLPAEAYTVHRLLGAIPGSSRFRHDGDNPLPFDMVIVDEASMLDLALAARLVDALSPRARLVLLGDRDQLASVETGAVFSQLCATRTWDAAHAARLRRLTGADLDGGAGGAGLANAVVWLQRSYRFDDDSGIGRLAALVNTGDAHGALAVLGGEDGPLRRCAPVDEHELFAGYAEYARAIRDHAVPQQALQQFDRYRVLCALREGPTGAAAINERLAQRFRHATAAAAQGAWYAGRPVMLTRNDHALRLFNGDIGIALPDAQGGLLVHFPAAGGTTRALAPARLPDCETAFALTVHKAQGSEFERVALVLPDSDSRVLTRELIYTALTRARSALSVHGAADVLAAAISRRTQRRSGLAERLGGIA